MADATAKSKQLVFFVKLALIALAIWDTLAQRRLLAWDPALAGLRASKLRRLAIASLILWTGAIAAGRLMAYL
jgi:hypothetical protein